MTSSGKSAPQRGPRLAGALHRVAYLRISAPKGNNLFAVIGDQRRALRSWLRRNHLFAQARREIAARRKAEFAAAGLA
jgi:hypothetical protein